MTKKETTTSATSPAHTPGPWRTDSIGLDRIWVLDEEGNYLAEIVFQDECGFVVSQDQQQANARLMAAAPELLEACEDLIECLEGWMEIADDEDVRDYDLEALQKGQSAVARAKGQAA